MGKIDDDLQSLKKDAKKLYEHGVEKASETYEKQKEAVDALVDQVKVSAKDLYQDGKQKVNDLHDNACDYSEKVLDKVREQPLKSLLIAGGVGFILSLLLKK